MPSVKLTNQNPLAVKVLRIFSHFSNRVFPRFLVGFPRPSLASIIRCRRLQEALHFKGVTNPPTVRGCVLNVDFRKHIYVVHVLFLLG